MEVGESFFMRGMGGPPVICIGKHGFGFVDDDVATPPVSEENLWSRARNGFTSRGGPLVFPPRLARATGPAPTILRHESSFIPRLRQAPSRRLPSCETQRNGLCDLQIEPEIQGPPRRNRRHPPLEKRPLSAPVAPRRACPQNGKAACWPLFSRPGGKPFQYPPGGNHAEAGDEVAGRAKTRRAIEP